MQPRYLSPAVCRPLFVARCLSPAVCRPLFVARCLSPAVCRPLFVARCLSPAVCRPLFVARCLSPAVCRPLFVAVLIFLVFCILEKSAKAQWSITYAVSPAYGTDTKVCNPSQSVTAAKTVTVSTTIAWGGPLPAPKKLTVKETAVVSWTAQLDRLQEGIVRGQPPPDPSGNISNCNGSSGLPDEQTVYNPDPQGDFTKGATTTGRQVKSYTVTNGTLTLPAVTLTATATVTSAAAHTTGSATASCTSYSVSIIEILRDNHSLSGDYAQALPGQKINLTIGGASSSTYEWTVPGETFYDYNPSKNIGQLVPDLEYDQALMTFYWTEGNNDERIVTSSIVIEGKPVTVAGVIKVYKPVSTFVGKGGYIQVTNIAFELHGDTPFPHGMAWDTSTVTVPFSSGIFAFFQTGDVSRVGYTKNSAGAITGTYRLPSSDSHGLDGGVPYSGVDFIWKMGQVVGRGLDADMQPVKSAGDSPSEGLAIYPPLISLDKVVANDSYTTWLMFKPDGSASCWVPLKSFGWAWGATADRQVTAPPQIDTLVLSSTLLPGDKTGSNTIVFPQWSGKINAKGTWESGGN